jgi:TrmH family RNA methyltransferase
VHTRVKQYLALKRQGSSHAIALEGLWAIRAAAEAPDVDLEVVFVCPPLLRGDDIDRLVDRRRTRVIEVGEKVLRRLVDRDGPDGLAAIAHLPPRRLDDLAIDHDRGGTVVVADSLDLAGNLGTLVRCADGAGARAVVVTERRVRLNHPLVVKASMGTIFTMPVVATGREAALDWLRAHEVRTVAADPAATTSYRDPDADYGNATAIVVGSERHGLHPFWRDHADVVVSIPMLGRADSLNVGHAAALLLYEALHRRSSNAAR